MDPLTREGIILSNRQIIIREFKIIDLTIEILNFLFEDEIFNKNINKIDINNDNDNRNYIKVLKLGIY
jgi:hypothetical protein